MSEKSTITRQSLDFANLGLSETMLATLETIGYVKPTPIQGALIPLALKNLDLVGQARTGTGKTAAFGIPIIERINLNRRLPQALVLTPTRELAVQVAAELNRLRGNRAIGIVCLYGGKPMKSQIHQLHRGAPIVVGTPGRVIDHLERETLQVGQLRCVVLDEADRMLDIGFRPDIERILRYCPKQRQTLMLSATIPISILEIAKRYMVQPKLISLSAHQLAADTIDQFYLRAPDELKFDVLVKLLQREQPQQAIIFCRTKLGTEWLYRKLLKCKLFTGLGTIHGDLSQSARDQIMQTFREGKVNCLVATDVVGRGIDVSGISHIINFDVPEDPDDYIHRVGRTGRMGRSGVAFTIVGTHQRSELVKIEQKVGRPLVADPLQTWIDQEAAEKLGIQMETRPKKKYRRAL